MKKFKELVGRLFRPFPNDMEMPRTNTPPSVFVTLIILAILGGILLSVPLGFWGVILWFVVLGSTTGIYTETVPGFDAHIALNHLTGKQRTLFQGLNFILPWEGIQEEKIDLKTDLKEVVAETWQSTDAMMETKYVYTIRPDYSGDNPGKKIILYASYEPDAIRMEGRAIFSMLFSDYYRARPSDDLKVKEKINREVFGGTEGKKLQEKFEEEHGVKVTVRLEDSDVDEATQKARDVVAKAKSFSEAVEKLMEKGTSRAEAEKIVKMMNIPGVQEYIISLKAEGIESLRDVTLLPPGLGGKK